MELIISINSNRDTKVFTNNTNQAVAKVIKLSDFSSNRLSLLKLKMW